ncbi:hypothetical protein HDR63_00700 [bacterium]|nr:hypothetical protein [bacterium]
MKQKFDTYDFYMQLKPVPIAATGDCMFCVFRNLPGYCEQMVCRDDNYRHVYWTFRHATAWEALDIFNNAAIRKIDIPAACRRKIAQAYGVHNK